MRLPNPVPLRSLAAAVLARLQRRAVQLGTAVVATLAALAVALIGLPGGTALAAATVRPGEAAGSAGRVEQGAPTDPAAQRAQADFARSAESRQVIVKFDDDLSAGAQASLREKYGLSEVRRSPTTGTRVLHAEGGRSARSAAALLRAVKGVVYAEPNALWTPSGTPDPRIRPLWGLDNTGQTVGGRAGTPDVDVNAPQAWQVTRGNPRTLVGVLDTGIDIDHPDLAGRIWTNPGEVAGNGLDDDRNGYVDDVHGWDFLHNDNTVYDAADGDEHGTHVAGTIAADLDNGVGVAGVAPESTIVPLKFLGPGGGSTTAAIQALDYAASLGVRVINASWGGPAASDALRDAIARSGSAFIAAAGNNGTDNDTTPTYPANYDLPNVLSVAAVDNTGRLASFSNRGATSVDVGAPGVDVLSTVPRARAAAQALQVTTAAYRATVYGFGLEDVSGPASRDDVLLRTLGFLDTGRTQPVLLVDDDGRAAGAGDTASFYSDSLARSGFTAVTTTVVGSGSSGPAASAMLGRTVLWETGDAVASSGSLPNLTPTDQSSLTTFLDGGGRLLLAGADDLYQVEGSTFVGDTLHTVHLGEGDARTGLTGPAGSAFAGVTYSVTGQDSPDGQPSAYRDTLAPKDSAAVPALVLPAVASYADAYASFSGTSMAAPHASGVAALVAATSHTADATAIVSGVSATGSPLASLAGTTLTGRLVRADRAVASGTVQGDYQPLAPARILDTRNGTGGTSVAVGPGQSIDVQATGVGGVPTNGVGAVALNVTVTQPTSAAFLTVHPAGTPRPVVSNLNFTAGQTVANMVVAKLGVGGRVTVFNALGSTEVIMDVAGWFSDGSGGTVGKRYSSLTPARILDTRNGTGGVQTALGPGQTVDVPVTGVGGVPASGVSAVAVNVTVTQPTASAFLTVYPSGTALPVASNLNFLAGLTVPNVVIAKVGANGKVSVYNPSGSTHVIFDIAGWFSDGSTAVNGGGYTALPPARVLDTRIGTGSIARAIGPGETVDVQVTGVGGVPAVGVSAVVLNVTVTQPTEFGFVTIHPSGTVRPVVSNLNFSPGQTVPNLVVAKVGAGGKVSVYNLAGSTEVVIDVSGWFSATS